MAKDFIEKYEEQLQLFKKSLKKDIVSFLDKNRGIGTSHDIISFLRKKNKVYDHLYKRDYNKAWYRVRKILLGLGLNRKIGESKTSRIRFLNYKWSRKPPKN